ncbi:M24 family metallopeptidase [Acidobacteriota bacterium]
MIAISPGEYRNRLKALQEKVQQEGLDLFIVSTFDNLYYLTGAGFEPLERPFFLVVWPEKPSCLLVPKLDHEHMKKAHSVSEQDIHTYWEYPSPPGRGWPERILELIGNVQRIGVEPSIRREITDQLEDHKIIKEPLVEGLRAVKSSDEISMIRRAANYADFAVERLLAASYFGASVAEGFAENRSVNTKIIRELDDWDALTNKVIMASWAAPRSAMPHSIPGLNDRLRYGPHVALALTRVNGYAAECERTFFTARPSNDSKTAFSVMLEARRMALGLIQPGLPCCELDATVNEHLQREGFTREAQRLHRTGHGIGLGNHEGPWIAEGSKEILAANMVISVEPGIYLEGLGGIRHSDTVLVTETGYDLLTKHPMDLESLAIRGLKPFTRIKGFYIRSKLRVNRKGASLG